MNAMSLQPHLWTREEYEKMVSAGVFHPEDRLELINGEILEMTPQSSAHATAVCLVDEALSAVYVRGFTVRVQVPMALGESSEPEPDVAVVRGRPRDYLAFHPTAATLGRRNLGSLAKIRSGTQERVVRCQRYSRVLDPQSGRLLPRGL